MTKTKSDAIQMKITLSKPEFERLAQASAEWQYARKRPGTVQEFVRSLLPIQPKKRN